MAGYRTGPDLVACYRSGLVTPEQIKQLRATLRCTARELATSLDVPLAEVQAWETGERFPTKQWVQCMDTLRAKGPAGIVRKSRREPSRASPMDQLDNPDLWQLLRKLLAHPKLFAQTVKLAADYKDPAVPSDNE